jgi:peptidoglycan/LPS O-acetylase OafA/YrhL
MVSATVTRYPSDRNFETIQALRFLAALMVVVTHSTFYTAERLGGGPFWANGGRGVDIFFVISGFVMVISSDHMMGAPGFWKKFIVRRLIRIMPMYWLATTIKLIVLLLVPSVVLHSDVDIIHIVSSYLLIPTMNVEGEAKPLLAVGWTLYYEMFFYVLFAAAIYLRANIYYFVGVILIGLSVLSIFRERDWPTVLMFANPKVLEFLFGMLIAKLVLNGEKLNAALSAFLFVAASLILIEPYDFMPGILPAVISEEIPAALLVLGAVGLEPYLRGRLPRTVLFMGDASYVLYLFHPLLVPLIPTVMKKIGMHDFSLSVGICIVTALCGGALVHVFVERGVTNKLKSLIGAKVEAEGAGNLAVENSGVPR